MQLFYNGGDAIGRYMGGKVCCIIGTRATVIGSFSRALFFLFFMLVMFSVGPSWLFNSDWFKMINAYAFGWTNGYYSTLCAILGP